MGNKSNNSVIFIHRSENAKTGPISCTYSSQVTCPKSCLLRNNGCYAEIGPCGIITKRLNNSKDDAIKVAKKEARLISIANRFVALDLRVHVVGDCSSPESASIVGKAMASYEKRTGRKAWTYTHAWRDIPRSSWGQVNVLASCETVDDVNKAKAMGYATSLIIPKNGNVPNGIKALECPFETKGKQCYMCRVCMKEEQLKKTGKTVVFRSHGMRFKAVDNILKYREK